MGQPGTEPTSDRELIRRCAAAGLEVETSRRHVVLTRNGHQGLVFLSRKSGDYPTLLDRWAYIEHVLGVEV